MDFTALQNKFVKRHLDNRTEWIAGGTDNKEALNDAYLEVYNKAIIDMSIQGILKTDKTPLVITAGIGNLPSDFLQPVTVYIKQGGYIELDKEDTPFRFQRTGSVDKILFPDTTNTTVYIDYIQKLTAFSNGLNVSLLPTKFDRDIINFAMVEYHRAQRDWAEVSNEVQYAEGKLKETIDGFWLE